MERKKQRCSKTTPRQYNAMLDFLIQNPDMIHGKLSSTFTEAKRRSLWDTLTVILNSDGTGPQKTAQKWRKTWYDLKTDTKSKVSALSRHKQKTSEEPSLTDITPLQENVASLNKPILIEGTGAGLPLLDLTPLQEKVALLFKIKPVLIERTDGEPNQSGLTPLQEKVASMIKPVVIERNDASDAEKAFETESTVEETEQKDMITDNPPVVCSSLDHCYVEVTADDTIIFEDNGTEASAAHNMNIFNTLEISPELPEATPSAIVSPAEEENMDISTPQVLETMNNKVYRRRHRKQEQTDVYIKELIQVEKRKAVALEKIKECTTEKNRLLQERNLIEKERNEIFRAIVAKLSFA